MIILGIDPGTATTGYGVIEVLNKKKIKYVECGVISTDKKSLKGDRLKYINNALGKLIEKHRPDVLSLESLYFFKNVKTVMAVSQAQGVILLTAAKKKIPVCEFNPLQVKLAITGYGRAEKPEVQKEIKNLLNLESIPKPDDAADGLALAITYFLHSS